MPIEFDTPIISAPLKFKENQKVTITLYHGEESIMSEAVHEYIKSLITQGTPLPIDGTKFCVRIEDVFMEKLDFDIPHRPLTVLIKASGLLSKNFDPLIRRVV